MPNTYTPNLNLPKPGDGDTGWGDDIRSALDLIDAKFPGGQTEIADGSLPLTKLATDVATQAELDDHAALAAGASQTSVGHTSWEAIQDMLAAFLVQGSGITLTYNDASNTMTIAAAALSAEAVQDIVGGMVIGSTPITATYDDAANKITFSIADAAITPAKLSFDPATQAELDAHALLVAGTTQSSVGHTSWEAIQDMLSSFIVAGSGVTLTYDDTSNTLTIASAALSAEAVQDIVGAMLTDSSTLDFSYDDAANTATAIVKDGSVTAAMLSFDPATQVELDAEALARSTADAARPTGVGGLEGQVAWYDSATALGIHANSIFRSAAGNIAIGGGSNVYAFSVDTSNRLTGLNVPAGTTSGTAMLINTIIDQQYVSGTSNVNLVSTSYVPPVLPPATTRILTNLRASVSAGSVHSYNLNMRAINALAVFAGNGAVAGSGTLGGTVTGQYAQIQNTSLDGIMSLAHVVSATLQCTSGGKITNGSAFRAIQPISSAAANYGDTHGFYCEDQVPDGGAGHQTGTANGFYQAGANTKNTYKGPSQFDGKATFNGGTAGIPRVFGGWPATGTPIVETITAPVYTADVDMTILGIDGWASTPGSGSSSTFDIERYSGGSWVGSIFSSLPSFASGSSTPSGGTLSTTVISAGDKFRMKWTSVNGTLAGTTVQLKAVTR